MRACENLDNRPEIRNLFQDWQKDRRNNQTGKALNEIGRNTGKSAVAIHEIFKEAISGGNDNRGKAPGDDTFDNNVIQLAEQLVINKIADDGDKALDDKGNRNIDHISGQKVSQCGTKTGRQTAVNRSEKNPGQNDDGVARMNVAAGSRCGNMKAHCGHTGQCGK